MNIGNGRDGQRRRGGFTMVEVLMALSILTLVMAGTLAVYLISNRIWYRTTASIGASTEASFVIMKMVHGIGTNSGLRAALASSVNVSSNGQNWSVRYATPNGLTNYFTYDSVLDRVWYSNNAAGGVLLSDGFVAAAVTNTGVGAYVVVSAARRSGRYTVTNQMSLYVNYRN